MKANTLRILSIFLILTLGILSIFYGVKYTQLKSQTDLYIQEKNDVNLQYDSLNEEFESLRVEFKEIEDSNLVLNGDLETRRQDLIIQKDEVSRLLRKERLTRTELDRARAMITELRNDKAALLAQLQQLSDKNIALVQENDNYSKTLTSVYQEKEVLEQKQDSLVQETTQLTTAKAELTTAKEELETKVADDAPKVEYSQVVPVKSISVSGVKYKNSGKERETSNNSKVDKIKINFTVDENPVAETGLDEYIVRIVGPNGLVVYDKERGSGEFKSNNGEGMKYTTKTDIEYDGVEKNVSVFWLQDQEYQEGTYIVQLFNKGFEVADARFELK